MNADRKILTDLYGFNLGIEYLSMSNLSACKVLSSKVKATIPVTIGFDTEFDSSPTGQIRTIQFFVPSLFTAYVIDLYDGNRPSTMINKYIKSILINERIVKVCFDSRTDTKKLREQHQIEAQGVLDLNSYFYSLGFSSAGMVSICKLFDPAFKADSPNHSSWLGMIRDDMIKYAACDAVFSYMGWVVGIRYISRAALSDDDKHKIPLDGHSIVSYISSLKVMDGSPTQYEEVVQAEQPPTPSNSHIITPSVRINDKSYYLAAVVRFMIEQLNRVIAMKKKSLVTAAISSCSAIAHIPIGDKQSISMEALERVMSDPSVVYDPVKESLSLLVERRKQEEYNESLLHSIAIQAIHHIVMTAGYTSMKEDSLFNTIINFSGTRASSLPKDDKSKRDLFVYLESQGIITRKIDGKAYFTVSRSTTH